MNRVRKTNKGELHYYQGYHDICVTFLLVLGEDLAFAVLDVLSLQHLRDFMDVNMDRTKHILNYLYPIVGRASPKLRQFMEESEVGTVFCHVIRYSHRHGKWNHDVPSCQKEWPVSGKTLAAVGTGVAAVVATPVVLAGAGFTAAGVAAGSIAAMIQTPLTAVGSWFALSQSAGVVGTALATKGVVGASTSAITYATLGLLSDCEKE